MDYLYRVLKIKTQVIEEQAPRGLPRYLTGLYRIQKVRMGKITVFLMYPGTELEQVDSVRKHIRELQKLESIPAVLMLNRMTVRQRERFIDAGSFLLRAYRDKKLSEQAADELVDSDAQMEIQFWKYDPKPLAAGNCVDPFSPALSLKDDPDERVEAEVEEMLETFWKEKYGKRD